MKTILFVLLIISIMGCSDTPQEKRRKELKAIIQKEELKKISAIIASQRIVKKTLKSPSSAVFQDPLKANHWWLQEGEESRHKIVSYVDSQNSFGAMIRTKYMVILKYNKKT